MIITRTPFRISLFGGGTDHPIWFEKFGGRVVSLTIDKYCYISTRVLPPFFEHKYRVAYSQVETVRRVEDIQHPVVREAIRKYAPELRLEIHHDGDLPARSGIGSSSAFAVGMIHSLLALKGKGLSESELAKEAINLEREILKENVGWQDQIACAVGGINEIEFGPDNKWSLSPLRIDSRYLREFQSRMILVFSGVQRSSSDVSVGLLKDLDKKAVQMTKLMNLSRECRKILESEGDLDTIGEMLNDAWRLKKEVNPISSSIELDNLYERAMTAGALGGKVLGAGGGGFMLFWVKKEGRESFLRNMGQIVEIPFSVCFQGSKVIYEDSSQMEMP